MTEQQAIEKLIKAGLSKSKAEMLNDHIGLEKIKNLIFEEIKNRGENGQIGYINSFLIKKEKEIIKLLKIKDEIVISNVWELVRTETVKAFGNLDDSLMNGIYIGGLHG